MYVLNDRPQGGSAYQSGRIELMIIRQGTTQDELGIWEAMRDWSADSLGANVSAKFYMGFTSDREQLFRLIQERHLKNMKPMQTFYSLQYKAHY